MKNIWQILGIQREVIKYVAIAPPNKIQVGDKVSINYLDSRNAPEGEVIGEPQFQSLLPGFASPYWRVPVRLKDGTITNADVDQLLKLA